VGGDAVFVEGGGALGLVEGGYELAAFDLGGGDRDEQQVRLGRGCCSAGCADHHGEDGRGH
jgi:hypothetical protein